MGRSFWDRTAGFYDLAQRDLLHLPDRAGCYGVVCAANVLHLLDRPADAVAELWRVTAPGGLSILPTFLTGESGPLFWALAACYRLAGFRQKASFTFKSYRAFLGGLHLPAGKFFLAVGPLPVGVAVFHKAEILIPEEPL